MATPTEKGMVDALDQIKEKRIKVVLDPASPFELTTVDARRAFSIQEAKRAHGKLCFVLS
jgi:hypothetical protein